MKKIKTLLVLITLVLVALLGWSQEPSGSDGSYEYACPTVPYLPIPPLEIARSDIHLYWTEPVVTELSVPINSNVLGTGLHSLDFEFLVDSLGRSHEYLITKSTGDERTDEALIAELRLLRHTLAESNLERRPVRVMDGSLGFAIPSPAALNIDGEADVLIGEKSFRLEGLSAYLKPDKFSELCRITVETPPAVGMKGQSWGFSTRLPCVPAEQLVGMEIRPDESGERYSLSFTDDFEMNEAGDGGRHLTEWQNMELGPALAVRFTGLESGFLSGEIESHVYLSRGEGYSSSEPKEYIPFYAQFRAKLFRD